MSLTSQEIKVYCLCHHHFSGLEPKEAAARLNLSPGRIRQILRAISKKHPELFPILGKRQYDIYNLYAERGESIQTIARWLGTSESSIYKTLAILKKKGLRCFVTKSQVLQYTPDMDGFIKEKF